MIKYTPRNNMVLIRIVEIGKTTTGIQLPQYSVQGKEFIVEAIGPDVKKLNVGDKCLMLGAKNTTYFELPSSQDLIVMEEKHVCLVIEEIES